jgi:hypothetical protein
MFNLTQTLLLCCFIAVLQVLLHFIYWDELPDMQELIGTDSTLASTLVAQHLLAAADRYALERLKAICESKLCEGVAINTVATTLALAEQHHCLQLKAVCLKFVALPENLKGKHTRSFFLIDLNQLCSHDETCVCFFPFVMISCDANRWV